MPYLNDEELASLHKVIDDAKDEVVEAKKELEETTGNLDQKEADLNDTLASKKKQNIILSVLTGIALALAFFFYSNNSGNSSNLDINEIKKQEATRLLDSIHNSNNSDTTAYNDNTASIENSINAVNQSISGEKIYSVQVGAFTKNRYTLLSETLAGISSSGDLFKYSIGLFKTLREAQNFRRELVKLGFKDAFVASYVDGIRQEIEHPN